MLDFHLSDKETIVSVNLNSFYSLKKTQVVDLFPKVIFNNLFEELNIFKIGEGERYIDDEGNLKTISISKVKEFYETNKQYYYDALSNTNKPQFFNPEHFNIFNEAENYNKEIKLTISKTSLKVSIGELEDDLQIDVEFTFPENMNSICFNSIDSSSQWTGMGVFNKCDSEDQYNLYYSYLTDKFVIKEINTEQ